MYSAYRCSLCWPALGRLKSAGDMLGDSICSDYYLFNIHHNHTRCVLYVIINDLVNWLLELKPDPRPYDISPGCCRDARPSPTEP